MPLLTTRAGKYGTASPAGYQGPGDVVSGAAVWYGLRAYNAAYAAAQGPCVELCQRSTGNYSTVFNVTTAGNLDMTAVDAWYTANAVGFAWVKTLYDQSGNGKHCTENVGNWGLLEFERNQFGTLPAIHQPAGGGLALKNGTGGITLTQPSSQSWAGKGDGAGGVAFAGIFDGSNFAMCLLSEGYATVYAGSSANMTAADNVFHGCAGVINGSSSIVHVDGTSTGGLAAGSQTPTNGNVIIGCNNFGDYFSGLWCEWGVWDATFTEGNMQALSAQQIDYWT